MTNQDDQGNNLQSFTEEVRDFLDRQLTPELKRAGKLCAGIYADRPVAQEWLGILNEQGWAVPAWPVEYGGTDWSLAQHHIFHKELLLASAPTVTPNATRMVGPVVIAFGTDTQKAEILPRIRTGEDWWAQGYSEPGSGSDLASLQCQAVRHGDHFVVNGTKIWTTHAQWSNKIFCLVRTDNSGKPQQGITFLLFDLDLPGITIQPIISISGDHELNQIFFDDVRVPVSGLLGEENDGWTVAKYLLQFERGNAHSPGLQVRLAEVKNLAKAESGGSDGALANEAAFAKKLAQTDMDLRALEALEAKVFGAAGRGEPTGAMSSILKVRGTELRQQITELGIEAASFYSGVYQPEARDPATNVHSVGPDDALTAMPQYLNDRAASIYAGSNEIQRNIMAKAILGL